jgi:hypothetical protein
MMTEQQMYNKLRVKIVGSEHSSIIPNKIAFSILNDFVDNISSGMYPKYAYHRANAKIDTLLKNLLPFEILDD